MRKQTNLYQKEAIILTSWTYLLKCSLFLNIMIFNGRNLFKYYAEETFTFLVFWINGRNIFLNVWTFFKFHKKLNEIFWYNYVNKNFIQWAISNKCHELIFWMVEHLLNVINIFWIVEHLFKITRTNI